MTCLFGSRFFGTDCHGVERIKVTRAFEGKYQYKKGIVKLLNTTEVLPIENAIKVLFSPPYSRLVKFVEDTVDY